MTRNDLVFVASRTIAIFLLIPLVFDLPTLPVMIYTETLVTGLPKFAGLGWAEIFKLIATPILQVLIAIFFWRCGPLVQRLFADHRSAGEIGTTGPA